MIMKNNFLFILIVVFASCENNVYRIIKDQDEIIALSRNKEIITDKERNFYTLITFTYGNEMQNEYFFNRERKGEKIFYTLFRDSIQFNPDTIINIDKKENKYIENICNYYMNVSHFLDSYGIKNLSGERYKNSPQVTIFLKEGILIYKPNVKLINDNDFANFKEIRNGWYILKN